jgi:hypothetical protein
LLFFDNLIKEPHENAEDASTTLVSATASSEPVAAEAADEGYTACVVNKKKTKLSKAAADKVLFERISLGEAAPVKVTREEVAGRFGETGARLWELGAGTRLFEPIVACCTMEWNMFDERLKQADMKFPGFNKMQGLFYVFFKHCYSRMYGYRGVPLQILGDIIVEKSSSGEISMDCKPKTRDILAKIREAMRKVANDAKAERVYSKFVKHLCHNTPFLLRSAPVGEGYGLTGAWRAVYGLDISDRLDNHAATFSEEEAVELLGLFKGEKERKKAAGKR